MNQNITQDGDTLRVLFNKWDAETYETFIQSKKLPEYNLEYSWEDDSYTLDDYLKVVERAIEIAGEDHVALGTDFDGGPPLPRGMRDIRDVPMMTDAMLRHGWSEERIRKFMGGNLLRVFRQIASKPGLK